MVSLISTESIKKYIYTIAYCIIYILCYIFYLNRYAEYAGFTLYNTDITNIILSVLIAVFPIAFYKKYKAISSFLSISIYIILYIPIIITFAIGSDMQMINIFGIQIVFLFCMVVLFYADRLVITKNFNFKCFSNKNILRITLKVIIMITILSTLFVLYIYRSNLRFVSFKDIYALRAQNNKYGTGFIARYLSSWLSVVFVPICLAYGLVYKKTIYYLSGCFSSLIIYMATGSKGIILFPFLFLVCYFFLKRITKKNIYTKIVFFLCLFLLLLLLFPGFSKDVFIVKSLIMWRTIGNGGYLTKWYYEFFSKHPYTYYSHLNIVNVITGNYPYDVPLGFVIGRENGKPKMNANANFWATDGIAALGIPGIILITFIVFLIFIFLNTISKKNNFIFTLLLMLPFLYSILNTSLFSSLLGGGGFLIIFFIILISNSEVTKQYENNNVM